MPNIVAANVTYTPVPGGRRQVASAGGNRFEQLVDVSFGNNSLTYPTGGVPLTLAGLQMPTKVEVIDVVDPGANAGGFQFSPDLTNLKLKVFIEQTIGTNTPLAEHTNATFVPNPATVRLFVIGF